MIEEHPGYGYRRISRELAEQPGVPVNHKRLRRVLKSYELGLRRCLPRSKPSAVQQLIAAAGRSADLVKGHSFETLEAFSTDFKELLYDGGHKKAHLMALRRLSRASSATERLRASPTAHPPAHRLFRSNSTIRCAFLWPPS